jgi:hypothetical protein
MLLADDTRSIGLNGTDTIEGTRKAQKYVTLVCAWLYRGIYFFAKRTRMTQFLLLSSHV